MMVRKLRGRTGRGSQALSAKKPEMAIMMMERIAVGMFKSWLLAMELLFGGDFVSWCGLSVVGSLGGIDVTYVYPRLAMTVGW